MKRIFVIDDEKSIRDSLSGIFKDEGYLVKSAESGEKALALFDEFFPDIIFLDVWLKHEDGLVVLEQIIKKYPKLLIIVISGHGNVETAVDAIKKGAYDFIEKPLSLDKVLIATEKAFNFVQLLEENEALKKEQFKGKALQLLGNTESIKLLRHSVEQVAPTDSWVLITGANGTGKEICARLVHQQSKRAKEIFVAINCAAIPEELIEAELFGYEKGAFTGAEKTQIGKFELANKGTLFLDEIGDMSLKTQAKVLRVLQERQLERVGGRTTIAIDVRIVAATNKDLQEEIQKGNFREDLYYRLNVFPLKLMPLAERVSDIPLFIENFMQSLIIQHGFKSVEFTTEALDKIMAYTWPGNARELKNFVERMLILYPGEKILAAMLPQEFLGLETLKAESVCSDKSICFDESTRPAGKVLDVEKVRTDESTQADEEVLDAEKVRPAECEKIHYVDDFREAKATFELMFLQTKLNECNGNMSQLARITGLERSSLYKKLKNYDLEIE